MTDIDRGQHGRMPRVRSLDLESQQDFVRGFRQWMFSDLDPAVNAHAAKLELMGEVRGPEPEVEVLRATFDRDPFIAARMRLWITNQRQMWKGLADQFQSNPGHYLSELDRADTAGPGRLELDPALDLPDYCRHEIHIQPGGYVGDDFAGALYHHGTNSFYMGQNDSDEFHIALAQRVARPADGSVQRIVDLGCGIGQLTLSLKEAFPDAEVLGLDAAAPLLRYAHKRGVDLGLDVGFVHRLAEDTRLASGSIDLATAYILFHEVPRVSAEAICAEVFRILRPGGVFDVTDFATGGLRQQATPFQKYRAWMDHHYNGERWAQEFVTSDFVQTLRDVGFEAEAQASKHAWALPNYVARKPG